MQVTWPHAKYNQIEMDYAVFATGLYFAHNPHNLSAHRPEITGLGNISLAESYPLYQVLEPQVHNRNAKAI